MEIIKLVEGSFMDNNEIMEDYIYLEMLKVLREKYKEFRDKPSCRFIVRMKDEKYKKLIINAISNLDICNTSDIVCEDKDEDKVFVISQNPETNDYVNTLFHFKVEQKVS
ncbi:hypothetical protein Goe21_01810 [Bacillus phage vB_BsuM-Goe21]|nr:hypothetical protein Goe21_01810 [Bacillus phage vB_BsuM-Goe21]